MCLTWLHAGSVTLLPRDMVSNILGVMLVLYSCSSGTTAQVNKTDELAELTYAVAWLRAQCSWCWSPCPEQSNHRQSASRAHIGEACRRSTLGRSAKYVDLHCAGTPTTADWLCADQPSVARVSVRTCWACTASHFHPTCTNITRGRWVRSSRLICRTFRIVLRGCGSRGWISACGGTR